MSTANNNNEGVEYRIIWKREGRDPKKKRYSTLRAVERFVTLLGPEPWKAYGKTPDELNCCNGRECGCGGETVRAVSDAKRAEMPKLEWVEVEQREFGPWKLKK